MTAQPTLLVAAGLDPSGGAGILADARVAAEHGVRVVGVVTALTVQDTGGTRAVHPIPADLVACQLATLLADVPVDAIKIGALGDEAVAREVARAVAATRAPVVWDPVLMSSRGGASLLAGDPRRVAERLLPLARLVTPNLAEAAALTRLEVADVEGMRRAARALRAAGAGAVLVKGGHLPATASDLLLDGDQVEILHADRLEVGPVHGTGCVLSTALACRLAAGMTLAESARGAKDYLTARLRAARSVGHGARCLV